MKNERDEELDDETSESLLSEIMERAKDAETGDSHNRESYLSDQRFVRGDQWPLWAAQARESAGLPMLTVNRLRAFCDGVSSDFRRNEIEIRVRGVDSKSDPETAMVLGGVIRQIEYTSAAPDIYNTAASNAVTGGFGYFMVNTRYCGEDTFDQELVVEEIKNPLSVLFDPLSVKSDGSDGRYCFLYEELDDDDFERLYPGASTSGADVPYGAESWVTNDTVRLAHHWYVDESEKKEIIQLSSGEIIDAEDLAEYISSKMVETYQLLDPVIIESVHKQVKSKPESYLEDIGEEIVNRRDVSVRKIKYVKHTATEIIEGPRDWPSRWLPIIRVSGKEIVVDGVLYRESLVKNGRDPQMMYNFWRSVVAEHLALQPKAPYILTAAMINGLEEYWDAPKAGQPYKLFHADPEFPSQGPRREEPPQGSAALHNEAVTAGEDIKAALGIYNAGLGAPSNERSGAAINARKAESDQVAVEFHSNLAKAVRHLATVLIDMIPRIYDMPRIMRIIGDDGKHDMVAVNHVDEMGQPQGPQFSPDMGKYDVYVNIGPATGAMKAESAAYMTSLVQSAPQYFELLGDLIVKNSGVKDAELMAERLAAVNPVLQKQRADAEGQAMNAPPPQGLPATNGA